MTRKKLTNIIKYPIFSIQEHAHYRELPWKFDKLYNGTEVIDVQKLEDGKSDDNNKKD